MTQTEVFLDIMPGETRGLIVKEGRADRLIIQSDDDPPAHRLGARSVARVTRVNPALNGAFVELAGGGSGFLSGRAVEGEGGKVVVEVTAEARAEKAPVVRRIKAGEGAVRLIQPGPTVAERLRSLAPGLAVSGGLEALDAVEAAEAEARGRSAVRPDLGLDVRVDRTRALIAVDIDLSGGAGDGGKARLVGNRAGIEEAARLIRLNGWGGLVVIDLVGRIDDPAPLLAMARESFGGRGTRIGSISRFGLLQLSLAWGGTPLDDRRRGRGGRDALYALRRALLTDRASPALTLVVAPGCDEGFRDKVKALGPRARFRIDPGLPEGRFRVEDGRP